MNRANSRRRLKESDKWWFFFALALLGTAILMVMMCWGESPVAMPRTEFTPGLADRHLTKKVICAPEFRTGDYRHVTEGMKKVVFNEYEIPWANRDRYEVDHLIALTDGGSNDIKNLWPQPMKEARLKDRLEVWVHREVCADEIDLERAQQKMANDWFGFYQEMMASEDKVLDVPDLVN